MHQQITRSEKQNLLKSVLLWNFICINTELQNNINLINMQMKLPYPTNTEENKIS